MTVPNNANTYLPPTVQIPSSLLITAITKSFPAVITAEVNDEIASNTYIAGQAITLTIPFEYGMQQANGLTVNILLVDNLDFYVDMNSYNFDSFVVPAEADQPASFAPAGSRNLQFSNQTNQVPFQSLNNIGN